MKFSCHHNTRGAQGCIKGVHKRESHYKALDHKNITNLQRAANRKVSIYRWAARRTLVGEPYGEHTMANRKVSLQERKVRWVYNVEPLGQHIMVNWKMTI